MVHSGPDLKNHGKNNALLQNTKLKIEIFGWDLNDFILWMDVWGFVTFLEHWTTVRQRGSLYQSISAGIALVTWQRHRPTDRGSLCGHKVVHLIITATSYGSSRREGGYKSKDLGTHVRSFGCKKWFNYNYSLPLLPTWTNGWLYWDDCLCLLFGMQGLLQKEIVWGQVCWNWAEL